MNLTTFLKSLSVTLAERYNFSNENWFRSIRNYSGSDNIIYTTIGTLWFFLEGVVSMPYAAVTTIDSMILEADLKKGLHQGHINLDANKNQFSQLVNLLYHELEVL